ncbi:MAG TPA: dienelactone hydrolase [Burkholderiales bacterium]|jgi:dienelactone hydrolase|nr:dienelactone hydrolase [Burkholderiales bacterium]
MRRLALAFTLLACSLPARAILQEQVVELAVTAANARGQSVTHPIKLTIFRDDAVARAPFLILNHGRSAKAEDFVKMARVRYSDNARYFVRQGFVVLVPTRIGYGITGGPDIEHSGGCRSKNYPPVYEATAQHTLQILAYARTLAYVDGERGIALGQSFGGTAAITIAAKNTPGVVAAVNFAGGGGGNPTERPGDPCRPDQLRKLFAGYGTTARIPTLWLYSENDKYFGREHPQAWFKAFVAAGGKGEFVQLPAHGEDGHGSFTRNPAAWRPAFEDFVRRNGF